MGRAKSYLLVALGFGLAGAIGAAFGTGTAQAVVASLVEIVNPATSPVPTNSMNRTDPGRLAYQAFIGHFFSCAGMSACEFSFLPVPAGHRVVVQQISVFSEFSATPGGMIVEVDLVSNGTPSVLFQFDVPASNSAPAFVQPVLLDVDTSQSVNVQVHSSGAETLGASSEVTLTGYELDCAVAACAAVATQ